MPRKLALVATVAVPEQDAAVPAVAVAVVGFAVAPVPSVKMTIGVPPAMVFVPVRATEAVAVEESLKDPRRHV